MNRSHLPTISLVAILGLAAFLRLWNLDATEFKYDEARVCNLAARFVDTGIPPVRGMGSSTGIDNPPLAVYLMSLPVFLSRDPLVASAFVALVNVLGVWGCYALGRRYWGRGVGLLAALLLAASPWAVFYSRKVWAQNLLLPWTLLFFALLLAWLVDGKNWALGGAIVALAALTQIHFATLAFVPVFALLLLVTLIVRIKRRQMAPLWKPLAVGIGVSALLYAPYLAADALTGWKNVGTLLATVKAPAQMHWEALRYALLNVGGREIHALAGPQRFREFLGGILNLSYWPDRVEEGLVVAGSFYLLLRWWRQRRHRPSFGRDGLLLLWLVTPSLFFLRSKSPVFPHYLIPLYPAPYLALAVAAVDLAGAAPSLTRAWKAFTLLGGLSVAAIVSWQIYLSLSIYAFVEKHDTPDGMGTPISVYREIAHTMERYAEGWHNRQVVMLCPGDDPNFDECPAVFGFMASRSLDLRFVDGNSALLFPRSEADTLVVLAPGDSIAAAELPRHAQQLSDQSVSLREGTGEYRFYRLPAGYTPLPPVQPEGGPAHLANDVWLLGYELSPSPTPGEATRLALYWQVGAIPASVPAQGYSFANHLLAAGGERCAQKDGPGYRAHLWRAGDVVLSWFDMIVAADAPPPPYHLRTGMYVYTPPDQFTTIPIVDAEGRPIADAIEWPVE